MDAEHRGIPPEYLNARKDFPPATLPLESKKDLISMYSTANRLAVQLHEEGLNIHDLPGTWKAALGYVNRLFGGLKPGALKDLHFVDVGGGSYGGSGSFGPDLSKVLDRFGAEVTLVDPGAQISDFSAEQLQRLEVVSTTVEQYAKNSGKSKADVVLSTTFFGSPDMSVGTEDQALQAIQLLREMSKVSDIQIHTINNLDDFNWRVMAELIRDKQLNHGLNVTYIGDITRTAKRKEEPAFDFLIIDNRPDSKKENEDARLVEFRVRIQSLIDTSGDTNLQQVKNVEELNKEDLSIWETFGPLLQDMSNFESSEVADLNTRLGKMSELIKVARAKALTNKHDDRDNFLAWMNNRLTTFIGDFAELVEPGADDADRKKRVEQRAEKFYTLYFSGK